MLWVWLPSPQEGLCLKKGTPGATFFRAPRKQRKAGQENSSLKEEHRCLTSLGRKFEELHPELKVDWRGASEV